MGLLRRLLGLTDTSASHDVSHSAPQAEEPWILNAGFHGHARSYSAKDQTSFLFGSGKDKSSGGADAAKVHEANKHSMDKFHEIKDHYDKVTTLRKDLDEVMAKHYAAMKPLCKEYMQHRAELSGLGGVQCQAAQGRVNAEDLETFEGPMGCLAPNASGSGDALPGTPVTLQAARCTHGQRELLCAERLNELARGDPAPGEAMLLAQKHAKMAEPGAEEHIHRHVQEDNEGEGGPPSSSAEGGGTEAGEKGEPEPEDKDGENVMPSMDEEFRKWCHPVFRLAAQPISEDLSRAVLAPSEGDEVAQAA